MVCSKFTSNGGFRGCRGCAWESHKYNKGGPSVLHLTSMHEQAGEVGGCSTCVPAVSWACTSHPTYILRIHLPE